MESIIEYYLEHKCDDSLINKFVNKMHKYQSFNEFLHDSILAGETVTSLTVSLAYANVFLNRRILTYLGQEEIETIKLFYVETYTRKCPIEYKNLVLEKLDLLDSISNKMKFLKDEINTLKMEQIKYELENEIDLIDTEEEKLFQVNIHNKFFENCLKLVTLLYENENNHLLEKDLTEIEDFEKTTPYIRGEQTLKLNLLHQFGIIKHLKEVWALNKISNLGIEILIAKIINAENPESIRPRLVKKDDPKLRNDAANEKTEKFLEQFNLTIDKIKLE